MPDFQDFAVEYADDTGVSLADVERAYSELTPKERAQAFSWLVDRQEGSYPRDWPKDYVNQIKRRYQTIRLIVSRYPRG